jgi:glutathione synthase/RimK-type ligase-like ATP-grasp enzyme
MKLFLYPYKKGSASCRALTKALKATQIKLENSLYKKKPNHLVLNWGNSNAPPFMDYNQAHRVKVASNKLETFKILKAAGISHPEWTTDIDIAKEWLKTGKVFCRTVLTGHSGKGILEFDGTQQAPLYVKYIKKRHEYRVHVFKGSLVHVQQKKKKIGGDANAKVRNLANGWIYAKDNIVPLKDQAISLATQSIEALGLDFGAVDLIYNEKFDTYYVLEVNTAPGLTGTTLNRYTEVLLNAIN